MNKKIKVLMIDNYDSFTYNLVHYIEELKASVEVVRNNKNTSKVIYPNNTDKNKKYFKKKLYGNLIGFHIDKGYEACKTFIDKLKLFYHVANIGDVRSLAIHPSSTTHSQLSKEDQKKAGVFDNYVRLSIGIEHIDDIIDDLDNALNSI